MAYSGIAFRAPVAETAQNTGSDNLVGAPEKTSAAAPNICRNCIARLRELASCFLWRAADGDQGHGLRRLHAPSRDIEQTWIPSSAWSQLSGRLTAAI